jgi:hypothetical protein
MLLPSTKDHKPRRQGNKLPLNQAVQERVFAGPGVQQWDPRTGSSKRALTAAGQDGCPLAGAPRVYRELNFLKLSTAQAAMKKKKKKADSMPM